MRTLLLTLSLVLCAAPSFAGSCSDTQSAAIAFLSVIAANFLSSQTASLDRDRMAAVSLAASDCL